MAARARLIVARHSESDVDPEVRYDRWGLTPRGRELAGRMGERLRRWSPTHLYSSPEAKARQTAEQLGEVLGLTPTAVEGLEEQHRRSVPFYDSEAEFAAALAGLFRRPSERVFGEESADEAYARFDATVRRLMRAAVAEAVQTAGSELPRPDSAGAEAFGSADSRPSSSGSGPLPTIVAVTHGTVLSLFVGRRVGRDPQELWDRLQMPAYAVLEWPRQMLVELVTRLD